MATLTIKQQTAARSVYVWREILGTIREQRDTMEARAEFEACAHVAAFHGERAANAYEWSAQPYETLTA